MLHRKPFESPVQAQVADPKARSIEGLEALLIKTTWEYLGLWAPLYCSGIENYQYYTSIFLIPDMAVVSDSSHVPQTDIGNYLGLYTIHQPLNLPYHTNLWSPFQKTPGTLPVLLHQTSAVLRLRAADAWQLEPEMLSMERASGHESFPKIMGAMETPTWWGSYYKDTLNLISGWQVHLLCRCQLPRTPK